MGAFMSVKFSHYQFGPYQFLYKDVQCSMEQLGQHYRPLYVKMNKHFKFSKAGGIFHDNPHLLQNPKKCRTCIGIFVNQGENHKIKNFLNEFGDEFKQTQIHLRNTYKFSFPYRNIFSFLIGALKVYPKYLPFVQQKQIKDLGCPIEYYGKNIDFIFPYGEDEQKQTFLSKFPQPKFKGNIGC
ncbi:hypothetical protein PPERSA_00567 [Pseudocohnilembus persalinus]|uniref:Uncharacterized protein n=1 Tax=Pseudocohnilembus persalinus TaxID=266149 RepID=A0A0V0QSH8_PSEPJ|nr:hypothetical protein PPERSA_00567 [Pseudocohnilembus persalinus]|eukprot:KRX05266.1 hypothetical protein PPERSA_00567 [Pseudocohnilembus persalinus]